MVQEQEKKRERSLPNFKSIQSIGKSWTKNPRTEPTENGKYFQCPSLIRRLILKDKNTKKGKSIIIVISRHDHEWRTIEQQQQQQ
ncbi:MAG: hypothetical protein Q8P67_02075, partial [archaeon]|nr:hypothetical protein [archaeon]